MSLNALAKTWCTPGLPLAVGGPSKITKGGRSRRFSDESLKISYFFQKRSWVSSSKGIFNFDDTGLNIQPPNYLIKKVRPNRDELKLLAVPPRFPALPDAWCPGNEGQSARLLQMRVRRAAREGFSFTCFHPVSTTPGSLLDSIELLVSVTA